MAVSEVDRGRHYASLLSAVIVRLDVGAVEGDYEECVWAADRMRDLLRQADAELSTVNRDRCLMDASALAADTLAERA